MLMRLEEEMGLFDEAAPERTQTEERKPFLFFFLRVCGDGTDTLKVGLIKLRRHDAES